MRWLFAPLPSASLSFRSGRIRLVAQIVVGILAILAVFLSANAAEANTVSTSGDVYNEGTGSPGNHRIWTSRAISHGTMSGEVRNYQWWCGPWGCYWNLLYMQPGNITGKLEAYKWTGSQWQLCIWTNWRYNTVTDYKLAVSAFIGNPPGCGSGYYDTYFGGYVWIGAWRGGWRWSGYHWLPG